MLARTTNTDLRTLVLATLLLSSSAVHGQAWRATSGADAALCATSVATTDGGAGASAARSMLDERFSCAGEPVRGNAFAAASIAQGFAVASTGMVGDTADSVTARADFTDIVQLVDVPAQQQSVTLRVTIALTAQGDIAPDDPQNFLFGRITVPGSGDYELRRCSIASCPDDPIASDLLSQIISVPRLGGGEFGIIGVAASVTLRTPAGSALLRSDVHIDVLDAPGARLTSASGQYATQAARDGDEDAVPDSADNCPELANVLQRDSDSDTIGNACDPDLNNDGVVNIVDLGLLRSALSGDAAAADLDGNGVVDLADVARLRAYFFAPPGPGLTPVRAAARQ